MRLDEPDAAIQDNPRFLNHPLHAHCVEWAPPGFDHTKSEVYPGKQWQNQLYIINNGGNQDHRQ